MADVNLTHTGAELDAAIAKVLADFADVSGVTAAAADVMTGKIFVDASGEEVTGTNDGSGDTSDATANAGRILAPYTAYVAAGKVTGVIPNNAGDVAAVSYHADSTSLHIVPAEGYTDGTDDAVVITDADFVAENIKSGVNIFGKEGSMEGGSADSIIIVAVDANKLITEVDASAMTEIYPYQFWNYGPDDGIYIKLTTITLPDDLEIIGTYAFKDCRVLALSSLPSTVTYIEAYAFQQCDAITMTALPSGITVINAGVFNGCDYLALTTLPSEVTSIGASAFQSCIRLALTSLPSNVSSVGSSAFVSCTGLTAMTIPESLTVIPTSMFSYCTNMAVLNLPTTLETINNTAFRRLTSLAKVWISDTCTTIAAASYSVAPFYECSSTLVLYCEAASKPAGWGTYYNYYGTGAQLTVNWGVTKEAYDAL